MSVSGVRRIGVRGFVLLAAAVALLGVCAGAAYADVEAFEGKWGTFGTGNGQFDTARSVAVAPNGDVYVADQGNNRIQYFSPGGTYKGKWGTEGSGNGQLDVPYAVAIAPNGDVYVADVANARIQYFSPTGTYKGKWGSFGSGNSQFDFPSAIAVASNGDVYVSDTNNDRIQRFGPTGTYKGQFGTYGTASGQLDNPRGLAVAPNGDIYVADAYNDRVQYFSSTGTYKGKWGSSSIFDVPVGIAVSRDGYVYVSDLNNDRIRYYGWYGSFRGLWGSLGTANGLFNDPCGIAVADSGRVYVADAQNDRIQYFVGQRAIQHDAGSVTFQRWVSGYNSAYSGGGYVYSPWANSALEVKFIGNSISWIGPKQPNYGMADVYLDGAYRTTVDCYASPAGKSLEAVLYNFPAGYMPDGVHTLKIVPTGTKNVASTGTAVVVDRFDVEGADAKSYMVRYDEMTGTIAGPWVKGTNSA